MSWFKKLLPPRIKRDKHNIKGSVPEGLWVPVILMLRMSKIN